jgi:DNA-binding CsgD family transcriptional regulator
MAKRGRPRHPDILTPREWEVLALLREGLTNDQVAQRLGITERTAKFHVSEILSKLGVSSRQEAAAWSPDDRRSWRALVLIPFGLLRRAPTWAPPALAVAIVGAVVLGLGALVWGLVRARDDAQERHASSAPVALPTPAVAAPSEVVWGTGPVRLSSTDAACGDRATADQYGVPVALELARWQPGGGISVLGLEAIPYGYVAAQVDSMAWEKSPPGWRLASRVVLFRRAHPNRFSVNEVFLRRLDRPDLLFRYSGMFCTADGSVREPEEGQPGRVIRLNEPLPRVVTRREGDYLTAEEVLEIVASTFPPDVQPVWLELGNSADFANTRGELRFPQLIANPGAVVWEVLLAAGNHWGPRRPGHEYGMHIVMDAKTGQAFSEGCCFDFIVPE